MDLTVRITPMEHAQQLDQLGAIGPLQRRLNRLAPEPLLRWLVRDGPPGRQTEFLEETAGHSNQERVQCAHAHMVQVGE